MIGKHLSPMELQTYVESECADSARAAIEGHLADCVSCRQRTHRAKRFENAMQDMPRDPAPREMTERILATIDWRAAQEQARRKRMPLIALATCSSVLLAIWFGTQMIAAFLQDDALDFFSLFTSRPDIFSTYSSDAVFALIESLPVGEILLTAFAVLIAIVLSQQLVESMTPRVAHSK
jgi:anti-sigma factor RsiW